MRFNLVNFVFIKLSKYVTFYKCPKRVIEFSKTEMFNPLIADKLNHATGLNRGSSENSFFTRPLPTVGMGHSAEREVGKAKTFGSVIPGILGSGLRGRVTPISGPPTGTSGKEGRVIGWPMAGSILIKPSGSS